MVFSLAATPVNPWLEGSDLNTIANEGSAEQQDSSGPPKAALDVVVTNIFTKVQQLWNGGDFVFAVANMRSVYQRFKKEGGTGAVTPASLGTVLPDPFYAKPVSKLFARGVVFVTGSQGLGSTGPSGRISSGSSNSAAAAAAAAAAVPTTWTRRVGLLDAQARRCGEVSLVFEYAGTVAAGAAGAAEGGGGDAADKSAGSTSSGSGSGSGDGSGGGGGGNGPKHRLRVTVEKITLCSVRPEEEQTKNLDVIANSERLRLALRVVRDEAFGVLCVGGREGAS